MLLFTTSFTVQENNKTKTGLWDLFGSVFAGSDFTLGFLCQFGSATKERLQGESLALPANWEASI